MDAQALFAESIWAPSMQDILCIKYSFKWTSITATEKLTSVENENLLQMYTYTS